MPKLDDCDIHVEAVIRSWAADNMGKIIKAYSQKGGWEGWAQVEIATALHDSLQEQFDDATDQVRAAVTKVKREVPVYPPTKSPKDREVQTKADIVVSTGPSKRREHVIIEMKCEGAKNDKGFVQRVQDDVEKVDGEILDKFRPAKAWALAFTASKKVYDEMKEKMPGADCIDLHPPAQGDSGLSREEKKMALGLQIALWVVEKEVVKKGKKQSST